MTGTSPSHPIHMDLCVDVRAFAIQPEIDLGLLEIRQDVDAALP